MPRPRKCCAIHAVPGVTYYKPRGIPLRELQEASLTVEGFEALRLADFQGLDQKLAAEQMQVSRATFGRILAQARHTVAEALVQGMALRIQGGHYEVGRTASCTHKKKQLLQPADASAVRPEEPSMTKIAISSEGPTLDDSLDPRFGRAGGFIIFDLQTDHYVYLENGLAQTMAQGAGIQAAENVVNAGVQAVLTGYVGPKAFQVLEAAGVRIAQNLDNLTVRQAIERFRQEQLEWADAPNHQGHGS